VDTINKVINILNKVTTYLIYALAGMGGLCLVVMTVGITTNVTLRYLFNAPMPFAVEYSGYMLVIICFFGVAYTSAIGGHLNVDIAFKYFPLKVKAGLEVLNYCLAMFVVALFFKYALNLFLSSIESGQRTLSIMETPVWIPQTFIIIGLPIFMIVIAISIVRAVIAFERVLRGKRDTEVIASYIEGQNKSLI